MEGEARNGNSSSGAAVNRGYGRRSKARAAGISDPSPAASRPLVGDVQHSRIKHIEQAVSGWENRLGFSHLSQLPIKASNGVSRINEPPKLLRELEICAEICPVFSPGF